MACPRSPVAVDSVAAGSTSFFPTWSHISVLAVSRHIQECLRCGSTTTFDAVVDGHTTPSVADIGASSVRLRLRQKQQHGSLPDFDVPLKDGGYLLGIRSRLGAGRFLPAVAGVPGQQGLDRYGRSRVGLAECVVMGRPVSDGTATVLPDAVLQEWMPTGSVVEVVVLAKLTDFFLGMNAGTWLRIRISELSTKGQAWACERCALFLQPADQDDAFLEGTGLEYSGKVGLGIEDSSADFQFWGGSGNAGVSGQIIVLAEGTKMAAE